MRALSRRAAEAPRRRPDPAPSRWRYRLHRLWLRPGVRAFARRGVPLLALAVALASWLADGREIAAARAALVEWRAQIEARPEFAVTQAHVSGALPDLEAAIRAALPPLPSSSLRLDPEAILAEVAAMAPVARASVRIAPGGVLSVEVEERAAVALWRGPGGLEALDAEGRAIRPVASRGARPELPLIAGEGAPEAVAEALALHRAAGPLTPALRGLVRVGARRWDAVLDEGPRLLLPERGAVAALERAAALDAAQDLTGRAVLHLDLRDPARPVLRLAPEAEPEMARRLAAERAPPPAGGPAGPGPGPGRETTSDESETP